MPESELAFIGVVFRGEPVEKLAVALNHDYKAGRNIQINS